MIELSILRKFYAHKYSKIVAILFIVSVLISSRGLLAQALHNDEMRIHFIDVGQGNATLLEFSCGVVLIDAGAEGPYTKLQLMHYLDRFFSRRTDLNKVINLVIITHAHKDHNLALQEIFKSFRVQNYIDNGLRTGSGKVNQIWAQDHASTFGYKYGSYSFDQAAVVPGRKGITNPIIDPLNCSGVNPKLSILSGRFDRIPIGMTRAQLDRNGNLHSLVIKVQFGSASFLFTGDLEENAMLQVGRLYNGTNRLNCDIWEVSHHGSYNGTTIPWLKAVSPDYAFISCGKWNSGKVGANTPYNTYSFGHPRIKALDMLQSEISVRRAPLDSIIAFYGPREKHRKYEVIQNIYCTAWDGTIVLKAFKNGTYAFL